MPDLFSGLIALLFALSLLPAILKKRVPPAITSLLTGFGLLVIGCMMGIQAMWFTAAGNLILALAWFVTMVIGLRSKE